MDEVEPHDPAEESARTMRQRAAEDLFDEIRVLPEEARESAIEAGSDDPWVRAEVRSLLRFDGPTVPTHGYGHGPARAPGFDAESCIGLSAGGFTLRRVIGVGGMGTVFEADQELPSRKIAVKVLHAATMRASALARFRKESAFLARIDHQNIARVISAGTLRLAGEGAERPYFAMELVEGGRPVTRWARDDGACVAETVRMMATACEAVGSGHRAGVVHLDLKPGNLLVSKSGALRVIDYGIARSLEESDGAANAPFAGTPQYMAPEQCARDAMIDSRADVYALGLILYELLAKRLPYETRGTTWEQTTRLVRETVPPDLRRVDSTIPRELAAIVAKATAKDSEARYGTASEFGDDLRRFLADEAVVARRDSVPDALLRFVRRNPLAATLALVAALAVASGTALSLVFAARAAAAAEVERVSAARARVQAAGGALEVGEPAEAVQHLERVSEDLRGWEWRHLRTRVDNHELYASSKEEILSVDSIDATGEVIGGITGGYALIADRTRRNPPVRYDLRDACKDRAAAYVLSVAGAVDGKRIFVVTNELDVLAIDRRDDSIARIAQGAMRARPSGRFVACAMLDGSAALVDPDAARTVARCEPGSAQILDCSIAKNGRSALLTLVDGSLRMIDIDPDAPSVRERWLTPPQPLTSRAPAVSPDGSVVMVAWRDERVTRHDPATGAVVAEGYLAGGSVFMLAIGPDNRTAAASSWSNEVRLIDTQTLALTRRLSGSKTHVWGVDFTADGSRIVGRMLPLAGNPADGEYLGAWLVDSDAAVRDARMQRDAVAACVGPRPGLFTVVGSDGAIREFDTRDGAVRELGRGPLKAIRVARAADWIAVGDEMGAVHLYRLRDGARGEPTASHAWTAQVFAKSIWALAASPDGADVVAGDKGQSIAAIAAADGAVRWRREVPVEDLPAAAGRRYISKILFLDDGPRKGELVTYAGRIASAPRAVFRMRDGGLEAGRSIGGGLEADDAVLRQADGRVYALGVTGSLAIGASGEPDRAEPLARNGGVLCLDAAEDRLFAATRDGSVRVVGFEPLLAIARFDCPSGMPIAIAFDDERDALTVVTNRGIARTWFGAPPARGAAGEIPLPTAPPPLTTPRWREGSGAK